MLNGEKWLKMTPKEVVCVESGSYLQGDRKQIKGPRFKREVSLPKLSHLQGGDSDLIRELSYHRNLQPTGGAKKCKSFWKAKARGSLEKQPVLAGGMVGKASGKWPPVGRVWPEGTVGLSCMGPCTTTGTDNNGGSELRGKVSSPCTAL